MNETNSTTTEETEPIPVILVHGWRPQKDGKTLVVWNEMKLALDKENIPNYEFSYLPVTGDPYTYAGNLEKFINEIKTTNGYTGKFDIVCHSMGALVSRFYMVRNGNYKNIRQWIGIAPVNKGSAFADLVDSNVIGYFLVKPLLYLFFGDIGSTGVVANMRTYDNQTIALNRSGPDYDGIMEGVTYHIIAGNKVPLHVEFKSAMEGVLKWMAINSREEYKSYQSIIKEGYIPTRVKLTENGEVYRWTENGDGAVANEQSMLNDITPHVIRGVGHADLTKDPTAIDLVINYYKNFKKVERA